jgi:hypothetical protein
MTAEWGVDRWHSSVRRVCAALEAMLDPRTGGTVVVVETLGSFTSTPTRKNAFHAFLESEMGFARLGPLTDSDGAAYLRTDYNFPDMETGARMVRFFFGPAQEAKYRAAGTAVMEECTGVWVKRVPQTDAVVPAAAE